MLSLGTSGSLRCPQCRRSHGFESQTNPNVRGQGEYYCAQRLGGRRQRLVRFKLRQSLGAKKLLLQMDSVDFRLAWRNVLAYRSSFW